MAERRMLAKRITESDAFLDMPASAQALYFHLNMHADDDGFINNPKSIQRTVGASADDLKLLLMKKFILAFESGVIVIKHWRIHNYIQSDRYHQTAYIEEKNQLRIDENKAYTMSENGMYTECIQPVSKMDTEVRLGKVRQGKVSVDVVVAPDNGPAEEPDPDHGTEKEADDQAAAQEPELDQQMDRIRDAWNAIDHTRSIKSIIPMTRRWDELQLSIGMFGIEGVLEAIDKIGKSQYLKSRGSPTNFDHYMNRNVIQQVLEGAYDQVFTNQKQNSFKNFDQRSYDYDSLEEKLFNNF